MDHKIQRNEFIKFYVGNEINPNLKKFLDTNVVWKQFFSKNKEEFKNIRERLIEISHKLGISVTDFKKLVSRINQNCINTSSVELKLIISKSLASKAPDSFGVEYKPSWAVSFMKAFAVVSNSLALLLNSGCLRSYT